MRLFITFVIGVCLGVLATHVIQDPRGAGDAAKGGINKVQAELEEFQYDSCTREFLAETQCFQNKPAKECDRLIVKRCGTPK
jgi:hypothetical protein